MNTKVTTMESQMSNLERSCQFDSKTLDDMRKKQSDMEKIFKKMEKSENEQKERLIDLQSRQMRDNLIFYKYVINGSSLTRTVQINCTRFSRKT